MAARDRYLEPYNPRAYVPGGSSVRKARAIQTQGRIVPVPKRSNPYVRPTAGGGSGPISSPSSPNFNIANILGASAQQARTQRQIPTLNFNVNYESDPVLARIRALGQQNVGNAQSEAQALRKQAILDTGLVDIGREIGVDESTLLAAQGSPTSLLAQLGIQAERTGRELDESLNQENLFWSGTRANKLSELARNRMLAEADLTRDLRSSLAEIDSGVLAAQEAANIREQEALEATAEAARQQALQDALTATQAGSTVESGLGGYIGDPTGGGVAYAPGPTPAQVENMTSSGIDPNTAIYAPQPETIFGPNNVPTLFGGEPTTVSRPSVQYLDAMLNAAAAPAPRNSMLLTPAEEVDLLMALGGVGNRVFAL